MKNASLLDPTNPLSLMALFALQGFCVGYYLIEVTVEVSTAGWIRHTMAEGFVTIVLLLSLAFTLRHLRATLSKVRRVESSLDLASGAFQKLLSDRFADWGLTPAEAEIAVLTLKGFSIEEISRLRQTASGTIRVQLSKIYGKSGVTGRVQFVSLFIEDLIETPISDYSAP